MAFDLLSAVGADGAMAEIFTEERAVRDWLAVEAAFTHGLVAAGIVDEATGARIVAACRPEVVDRDLLWTEAAMVGYPILPLVRMICGALDSDDAGFVHYGATTQDIMDSALALQMRDAAQRLVELVQAVGDALAVLVERYADTVMAGRTHAQQAVRRRSARSVQSSWTSSPDTAPGWSPWRRGSRSSRCSGRAARRRRWPGGPTSYEPSWPPGSTWPTPPCRGTSLGIGWANWR